MTFCYMFRAMDRGGIGIVSDRRISVRHGFDGWEPETDDALKFGLLTPHLGLAFAGQVSLVAKIIEGLSQVDFDRRPSGRMDVVRSSLAEIYKRVVEGSSDFLSADSNAQFIFFDTYRRHSQQRYRLLRVSMFFHQGEKRLHIAFSQSSNMQWAAIGASAEIRKSLADLASTAMSEFANRQATVRKRNVDELAKIEARRSGPSLSEYVLDTTRGEPVCRVLETHKIKREFGQSAPDYTQVLGMVASNKIQAGIEALHSQGDEIAATIGANLHVASYHPAYGLQVLELN